MDEHDLTHRSGAHCVSCCGDLNCPVPECVEFIAKAEADAMANGLWAVTA